jgi:hypothetical protein
VASSFGNATTRGEAIVPNTRASSWDLLLQGEVVSYFALKKADGAGGG